jgi:SAM-dependent methyltransferase
MAIPFSYIDGTGECAINLPPAPCRVLDVGQSNVYDCNPNALSRWLKDRGASPDRGWIEEFTKRSGFDASATRINGAFFGDLCAAVGLEYVALDILDDPRILRFDLNRDSLPDHLREVFDLVINSGTTEHVLNQLNAFKVIHDAVRSGGEMLHLLPICGHTDHGYVTYNGRLFFDLAGYNDYEIVQIDLLGMPDDGGEVLPQIRISKLLDSTRNYAATFPILRSILNRADLEFPDIALLVRYRKRRSARFWPPSTPQPALNLRQVLFLFSMIGMQIPTDELPASMSEFCVSPGFNTNPQIE